MSRKQVWTTTLLKGEILLMNELNQIRQDEETVDTFVTALYTLAEGCSYGTLHDEMICDRIVVRLLDSSLSEKLQLDLTLTLETTIKSTREREPVKNQQAVVRGHSMEEVFMEGVSGSR